jgi:hypothetical protein
MHIITPQSIAYEGIPPTPSAETERIVRDVLKGMDSLLDICWIPIVFHNRSKGRWEGRYALTCRWPQIDKRWTEVQSGKVPEQDAYDVLGWLCEDMQDPQSVPSTQEGIQNKVIGLLGAIDNTRYPWKSRMLGTIEKNKRRHETMKAEVSDMTHDAAGYYYRQAKGNPQVPGANFNSEGKLQ